MSRAHKRTPAKLLADSCGNLPVIAVNRKESQLLQHQLQGPNAALNLFHSHLYMLVHLYSISELSGRQLDSIHPAPEKRAP